MTFGVAFKVPINRARPGLRRDGQDLQMMLINRFCKFPKSKVMNYHMQVGVVT